MKTLVIILFFLVLALFVANIVLDIIKKRKEKSTKK